ncbi:hypothetical protein [Psychrobacter fulvigenes]|uniref:hypothetical protein n=1 Tax=Psychrobacter fulvigenes TaxID=533323 RepID=UPI001918397E|nr:hypothetical protein [Psychrobacter fulvigenes]
MLNKNNNTVFDTVKADALARDKSVSHYLSQERQRAALTRLPSFEQATEADIALLRQDVGKLYRLLTLIMVLLLAIAAMGGALCLLSTL